MRDEVNWEELLRTCIHCGLCLNACPTYRMSGDEADSPRGRLVLLHELLSGDGSFDVDREHIDHCLACLGCQTVCPSGVPYSSLLEQGRRVLGPVPGASSWWRRWVVDEILPHPARLRVAAQLGSIALGLRLDRWMPGSFATLLRGLPRRPPQRSSALALADRSGEVAVLAGCAQSVFTPEVLDATLALIRACGARPFVPEGQGCCGALSHHQGSGERAMAMGRAHVEHFAGAETIVVPSAGCSAHLKALGEVMADDIDFAASAETCANRTFDAVEWLAERADLLSFRPDNRRVAYHPPCHHTHAQGLEGAAEALLARVPELELVEIPQAELCCGSAGSWSLQYPDSAHQRREEKLDELLGPSPDLVLTANPGCELFLDAGLAARPSSPRIEHLVVYLHRQLRA